MTSQILDMSSLKLGRSFSQLPGDIMLEILGNVDLEDVLSFLATCRNFYSVRETRSLWLRLLKRMDRRHPLPCSFDEDLTKMDLHRLIATAMRARRLQNNLARDEPQPIGLIRSHRFNQDMDVLGIIPGADLILLHIRGRGIACLWDISAMKSLASVYIGRTILLYSDAHFERGKFLIGFEISDEPDFDPDENGPSVIRVLEVKHGSAQQPSLREVFHVPVTTPFPECLFLDSRYIGVLGDRTEEAYRVCIYDLNSDSKVSSQLQHVLPSDAESGLQASIIGDYLYLMVEEEEQLSICHYAIRDLLSSGVNPPHTVMDGNFTKTSSIGCFHNSGLHLRGVIAVSLSFGNPGMIVRFWPTSSTDNPNPELTFTNAVEKTLRHSVISNPYDAELIGMGNCANDILIATKDHRPRSRSPPTLHLVRFDPDTHTTRTVPLALPSNIILQEIVSVHLEECKGRLILLDESWTLWVVSYS
ncbi:hypothetical protein JAAARDRAFT_503901 [Jaapia argillacea MUCL 33604]|uniref:F-box domain-containing protein n=1 Tax=Jaapia argillacea MUCL 33604 TaxID=933084 RepID=A0A067P9W2_9AGAM|nr:hypothetical protein JAAARDRAFT_503901 [Jaapia argillacea MUCL 33604]